MKDSELVYDDQSYEYRYEIASASHIGGEIIEELKGIDISCLISKDAFNVDFTDIIGEGCFGKGNYHIVRLRA